MSELTNHINSLSTRVLSKVALALRMRGFSVGDMTKIPEGLTPTQHANAIENALLYHVNIGHDFAVLMEAVKKSPMLQAQWDDFMIALKMMEGKK